MEGIATISINFTDGRKEIINAEDNNLNIIMNCISSAKENKTIYFTSSGWQGYTIIRLDPGAHFRKYVRNYRNGEYTWCSDYTYAKHFSKETATKHIEELMKGE